MPSEPCDGCMTWLEPGGGKKIHLTNGSLYLCEPCLADLNRNNPALAEVDRLRDELAECRGTDSLAGDPHKWGHAAMIERLGQQLAQRDALCRELATALRATAKWQDEHCWCFGWNANPCNSQPACVKANAALAHAREQGMLEE